MPFFMAAGRAGRYLPVFGWQFAVNNLAIQQLNNLYS